MDERMATSKGPMRAPRSGAVLGPAALALLAAAFAAAQQPDARLACDDGWGDSRRGERECEIREMTLPASGALAVDARPNGGIEVTGWDRDEVLVRAKVSAWAGSAADARAILDQVVVRTDDTVRAEGPEDGGRRPWSASYEIFVPRATDLTLETRNGGIAIESVRGELELETVNGGLSLRDVAGRVSGRTTNGGIDVALTGATWDGESLDVRTTNGGVRLRIPEAYSARLEAGTVNGGIDIDFPVTVQGRLGRRSISTTLGEGGPLVAAHTTNGGVRVSRN